MDTNAQNRKAQTLLSLHTNGRLFVLPNIWDPIGARILEPKGYPTVAAAREPCVSRELTRFLQAYGILAQGTILPL